MRALWQGLIAGAPVSEDDAEAADGFEFVEYTDLVAAPQGMSAGGWPPKKADDEPAVATRHEIGAGRRSRVLYPASVGAREHRRAQQLDQPIRGVALERRRSA